MNNYRNPKDLTSHTLLHYEQNSQGFWHGTKDHDVSQNYHSFLSHIDFKPPYTLLDLGCGPGRDLLYFKNLGHHVVGLDGCATFCTMARQYSGCQVLHQDFLELDLKSDYFCGIFANASLFHVPRPEFLRILNELNRALKTGGILFSSNPRGNGEGMSGSRYGYYMELVEYQSYLKEAGFELLEHYYRPPGLARDQQHFLACVMKKTGSGHLSA